MHEIRTGKREQILDVATSSIMEKGFAATSIEEIIVQVGITKSGFFYHFAGKNELAKALFERYFRVEDELFDDLERRAFDLNDDPLHGFLIWLKLLAELFDDLPNGHPGCLVALHCYQSQIFNREIRELNEEAILSWRHRFRYRLERIAAVYPLQAKAELDDLADMLTSVIEGGIILSRVLRDTAVLGRQVMLYREFIRISFIDTRREH